MKYYIKKETDTEYSEVTADDLDMIARCLLPDGHELVLRSAHGGGMYFIIKKV